MFSNRKYNRSNQQLVAHCFLSKSGEVQYNNYDEYNQKQEEQEILAIIEANEDY